MKENIIFACDLDNTLLVSPKDRQAGDICVEVNKGKEQSFMTRRAVELLKRVNRKVCFIPVTTRSEEQFRRIKWPEGCEPCIAAVANGARLLKNGEVVDEWSKETDLLVDNWREELQVQYDHNRLDGKYIRCRIVDNSYLFLYCAEDADVKSCERHSGQQTKLTVASSGRKIYLFPPGLEKGWALMRLKKWLGCSFAYAAGDSLLDVSMLRVADESLAHSGLCGKVRGICWYQPEGVLFSEWLLDKLLERLTEKNKLFLKKV